MAISKVIYGDTTLIDLTNDNIESAAILSGFTAHSANGEEITGSIISKAAETYTPGTSNKTIAAGIYLAGTQTILGDENLVASNIAEDTTIFGVTGSLERATAMTAAEILAAVQAGWV